MHRDPTRERECGEREQCEHGHRVAQREKARVGVLVHDRVGGGGRDAGRVECVLQVRVGDERDTTGELDGACVLTASGTSGFESMPLKNAVVRLAINTDPASAVPSDAPRFVSVFCRPPTSPVFSSDTADTVTAPSCDASAPMPSPASSIGQVTISGPAPASSPAIRTTMPRSSETRPNCTTRRGDAFGR